MADSVPSYLYKETRINLDSQVSGSTVILRLPSHGTSWASRTSQKRSLPLDIAPAEDEEAFKQRYLASAASIYYRQWQKAPRRFLWRVLEDGKVLSIRAVDFCKQGKAPDAHLTLRLNLPSPIRPTCVAFADTKDRDVLSVFVLTDSNHLYTLTLRPEFFSKRSATEDNVGDWCKTYLPTAFSNKVPHRLVALNTTSLLATLHDGGFLKLDMQAGGNGAVWQENHYNEGSWGLRSLIPFHGNTTTRYGKVNMDLSAITSIASPATLIDDVSYVFTVSLDHRLRVWNLDTRKIAYSGDILGQERLPTEISKHIIHPSHSQLVKVYKNIDDELLVVTYSPVGAGQFKFWGVQAEMDGNIELEDRFPGKVLMTATPTADVWTLADFSIVADTIDIQDVTLWTLWKNNLTYRLQKLDFRLGSGGDASVWSDVWTSVVVQNHAETPLPILSVSDPSDSTEKWLGHILYPGRFTTATIETSIALYERGMGSAKTGGIRSRNLAERMCSLVASTAALGRTSEGTLDFEQFRTKTDAQWRRFYRLVMELDKLRGEALCLASDPEDATGLIWVVTADGLAAVRDCSAIERISNNLDNISNPHDESLATIIFAASAFQETFSEGLMYACKTMLNADLFQQSTIPDSARLRSMYENCNFAGHITDDDYAQLIHNLGGNLSILTKSVYVSLVQALTSTDSLDDRLELLPLADVGRRTVFKGVQDTVELHRAICYEQIILLAFIEGEVDQEEEDMGLDTGDCYRELSNILRRLELLHWLCKTQISLPLPKADRRSSLPEKASSPAKKLEETKTVTALEGVLGHLLGIVSSSDITTAAQLSELLLRICHPDSEFVLPSAQIQCFLLKINRADLALDFSRFCRQDPFSIYIQGRVSLGNKDSVSAALYFKKAAFGLAHPDPKLSNERSTAGLLDEVDWTLLYNGLPRYYSHVVSLFESEKAYSYVIDFARLALQFASPNSDDEEIIKLRTDILSRLFNAALQTSSFDIAYSTVTLFSDHAVQHSLLRYLVIQMCESSSSIELLELPFLGLQDAVDEILASKCHSIVDVTVGVPYHKILYAWRIRRNDFRGAAAVSLERLQRMKMAGMGDKVLGSANGANHDELETPVTKQYLMLINALSCVDPKQAWILAEDATRNGKENGAVGKRKVFTLDDIRKDYQSELDRIAAIENNQFAFAGGDEMDLV